MLVEWLENTVGSPTPPMVWNGFERSAITRVIDSVLHVGFSDSQPFDDTVDRKIPRLLDALGTETELASGIIAQAVGRLLHLDDRERAIHLAELLDAKGDPVRALASWQHIINKLGAGGEGIIDAVSRAISTLVRITRDSGHSSIPRLHAQSLVRQLCDLDADVDACRVLVSFCAAWRERGFRDDDDERKIADLIRQTLSRPGRCERGLPEGDKALLLTFLPPGDDFEQIGQGLDQPTS